MSATASPYSPATGLRARCHRLAQHAAAALFLPPNWRATCALMLPHQQSPNKLTAGKPVHDSPCILHLQEQGRLLPAQHGSSSPSLPLLFRALCSPSLSPAIAHPLLCTGAFEMPFAISHTCSVLRSFPLSFLHPFLSHTPPLPVPSLLPPPFNKSFLRVYEVPCTVYT